MLGLIGMVFLAAGLALGSCSPSSS